MDAFPEVYLAISRLKMNSKQKNKRKKNARIVCRGGNAYWTTQAQFWQWVRDCVIVKTGDQPLTGKFIRAHEEKLVVLSNTVLNLACPNHLSEALSSRRLGLTR
jgi:hypothetical protein